MGDIHVSILRNPSEAEGEAFRLSEHEGHLCLFLGAVPGTFEHDTYGKSDTADCDLAVCFDEQLTYTTAMVFGKALVPKLIKLGDVQGFVGKGEAKGSKAAPWILTDSSKAEVKATEAWMDTKVTRQPGGRWALVADVEPF